MYVIVFTVLAACVQPSIQLTTFLLFHCDKSRPDTSFAPVTSYVYALHLLAPIGANSVSASSPCAKFGRTRADEQTYSTPQITIKDAQPNRDAESEDVQCSTSETKIGFQLTLCSTRLVCNEMSYPISSGFGTTNPLASRHMSCQTLTVIARIGYFPQAACFVRPNQMGRVENNVAFPALRKIIDMLYVRTVQYVHTYWCC